MKTETYFNAYISDTIRMHLLDILRILFLEKNLCHHLIFERPPPLYKHQHLPALPY